MDQDINGHNSEGCLFSRFAILLNLIIVITIILLFVILGTLVAYRFNNSSSILQLSIDSQFVPSSFQAVSPKVTPSALPSQNSQDQQQLTLTEFVIYFSGVYLAIITTLLALGGLFGFFELRRLRRLRDEISDQSTRFNSQ